MNKHVYNTSLLVGIASITAGVAFLHIPSALIVFGCLVLGLTLYGAGLHVPKS